MCVSGAVLRHALPLLVPEIRDRYRCSLSDQILAPGFVDITFGLLQKANQTLPLKNPTKLQLFFEHVSFS